MLPASPGGFQSGTRGSDLDIDAELAAYIASEDEDSTVLDYGART